MRIKLFFPLFLIVIPLFLNAKIIGYRDRDKNHVNDLFKDANGDGINDVTGKKYKHRFPFVDKNKDGINDIFIDINGDGFNDVKNKLYRTLFKCIDYNRDGINDITGKRYKMIDKKLKAVLKISKWIKIESKNSGETKRKYKRSGKERYTKGKYDTFIDKNKNGIDDRRELKRSVIIKKRKSHEAK